MFPESNKLVIFRYAVDIEKNIHSYIHADTSKMSIKIPKDFLGGVISFQLIQFDNEEIHNRLKLYISNNCTKFNFNDGKLEGIVDRTMMEDFNLDFMGIEIIKKTQGTAKSKANARISMEIRNNERISRFYSEIIRNKMAYISEDIVVKLIGRRENDSSWKRICFILHEYVPYYPGELKLRIGDDIINCVTKENNTLTYKELEFDLPDKYIKNSVPLDCIITCPSFNKESQIIVADFSFELRNAMTKIPIIQSLPLSKSFSTETTNKEIILSYFPQQKKLHRFRYETDINNKIHSILHTKSSPMFINIPDRFIGYRILFQLINYDNDDIHERFTLYSSIHFPKFQENDKKVEGIIDETMMGNFYLDFLGVKILKNMVSKGKSNENARLLVGIRKVGEEEEIIRFHTDIIRHQNPVTSEHIRVKWIARELTDICWKHIYFILDQYVSYYPSELELCVGNDIFQCLTKENEKRVYKELKFDLPEKYLKASVPLDYIIKCPTFAKQSGRIVLNFNIESRKKKKTNEDSNETLRTMNSKLIPSSSNLNPACAGVNVQVLDLLGNSEPHPKKRYDPGVSMEYYENTCCYDDNQKSIMIPLVETNYTDESMGDEIVLIDEDIITHQTMEINPMLISRDYALDLDAEAIQENEEQSEISDTEHEFSNGFLESEEKEYRFKYPLPGNWMDVISQDDNGHSPIVDCLSSEDYFYD